MRRLARVLRDVTAALLVSSAQVAAAEPLPNARAVATPDERALLEDIETLAARRGSPTSTLAALDALLPRLDRPTPLRGLVQFYRAILLQGAPARDAIEESIRLLPAYSAPLFLGARIEAYSDRPDPAVALLIRASHIDPQFVSRISDYELNNLLLRLPGSTDRQLRRRLIERLFEIGWRGESLVMRSVLASEMLEFRIDDGDIAAARALIPRITSPLHARGLLMQNKFAPIWADVERWAGPRQDLLWPLYLAEAQAQWTSTRRLDFARTYVTTLAIANRYQQIVNDFLPVFDQLDAQEDYDSLWLASPVAEALAHLGRWDEADSLFTRAMAVWPVGTDANALNLLANRGRFRYVRGDLRGAVTDLRQSIADGSSRGGEVATQALYPMHYFLACALHRLGRDREAGPSIDYVIRHGSAQIIAHLWLCLDRKDNARRVIRTGLEDSEQRRDAINFLQIEDAPPFPSAIGRELAERHESMRTDPVLLAALAEHGRILPYRAGDGAAASPGSPPPSR